MFSKKVKKEAHVGDTTTYWLSKFHYLCSSRYHKKHTPLIPRTLTSRQDKMGYDIETIEVL